jgi:hypothetical protein
MKRDNFDSYIQLLRDNGVDRLYHVTSRENWESMRMNGIYSAENQQRNNMAGRPIMDEMSRIRDHKLGLDKYVHLSFSANPVFLEAALKAKTAGEDYLVVEISLDVLNNDEVIFCNMDSHYEDVLKGTSYSHLSSINIKAAAATQRDQIALKNRRFCSAEILIPAHVSSGHILNRIELDNKVNDIQKGDEFKRNLIVIMVDETVNMKHPIIVRGHSYSSAAKYAEAAINKLITKVALSYNAGGKVSDKYDIAVFGCGYSYGIAPLWDRKYSDDGCSFRSAHDLYDTFIRKLGEGTPRWIQTGSNSYDANYEKAFKKVKEFLQPTKTMGNIFWHEAGFYGSMIKTLLGNGVDSITNALLGGQYENPEGVYYGGVGDEDSTTYVKDVFEKTLKSNYENIIHLDIHSGYGARYRMVIFNSAFDTMTEAETIEMFQYDNVIAVDSEDFYATTGDTTDFYYRLREKMGAKPTLFSTCFEFGTIGDGFIDSVISMKYTVEENQNHWYPYDNKVTSKAIWERYHEMFYPTEKEWREKTIEDFKAACKGVLDAKLVK